MLATILIGIAAVFGLVVLLAIIGTVVLLARRLAEADQRDMNASVPWKPR